MCKIEFIITTVMIHSIGGVLISFLCEKNMSEVFRVAELCVFWLAIGVFDFENAKWEGDGIS